MRKFWTTEEDNILRECIRGGMMTFTQMHAQHFPYRTLDAVIFHANQKLKLVNPKKRKYFHDDDFWSVPNLRNSYWAGVLAADGSINDNNKFDTRHLIWRMAQRDLPLMEQFAKEIKYTGKIKLYNYKNISGNISNLAVIKINSQKWTDELEKIWNIVPRKTNILRPPNINDENFLSAFLRGYIDGDGSIHVGKTKKERLSGKVYERESLAIQFVSCSHGIMQWIKEFTEKRFKNDGRQKLPEVYRHPRWSVYNVHGQRAIQMFLYLSKLDVPCLDRKWKNPVILEHIRSRVRAKPELYAPFLDPIAHKFIWEEKSPI